MTEDQMPTRYEVAYVFSQYLVLDFDPDRAFAIVFAKANCLDDAHTIARLMNGER